MIARARLRLRLRAARDAQRRRWLRGQHGSDSAVLAGGQSLMPMLNLRLARPEMLIDLGAARELFPCARATRTSRWARWRASATSSSPRKPTAATR
ncbi:MAG: hypothetical protein U0S48_05735 [Solirubrobacteraceae bacterium]